MSDRIPFEIQAEIIKRLPVKSLMQSRSLSKPFKSLIDSAQFIADYNACESRPPHLFLRYADPLNVADHYYQFLSIADDNCFPQHIFTTPTPYAFELLRHLKFVGSSNGLLCFYGGYEKPGGEFPHSRDELAIIWNPSLKKYVEIAVPVMFDIYSCILGFGVHPNTNDPMIVKINDVEDPWYIEVFTLSSQFWRCTRSNEPRKSIHFEWSQVALDGFIYWCAVDTKPGAYGLRDPTYNLIMSFDMTTEVSTEINLPDCLLPCDRSLPLSKLKESLVVLDCYRDVEKPVCDVWKMNHGVTKSFTKLFAINLPLSSIKTILGFRKNGEPMMGKLMDGRDESYKLEVYDTSIEDIKDYATNGGVGKFFVSSYKETLLLHDQKNHDYIPLNFNSIKR